MKACSKPIYSFISLYFVYIDPIPATPTKSIMDDETSKEVARKD